eukprot:superscaffoldBa00002967_g15772
MDSSTSLNLVRAEARVLVHSPSLKDATSQLPLPATVTVSSELVEDLLVQLMLRLNPLRSSIGAQLDQQQLLTLCLHLSAVTLETLKTVPGVSLDANLPPPPCNIWKVAVLLQSSLMKTFGTSIQVKKRLVKKDPALLNFIPQHIIKAVLTKAESAGETAAPTLASDEESRLFSQFLPESVKEEMFEQHGSWIRCTKVFSKAFPIITDEDMLEYQQRITKPRLSSRDVVWVDKKYFVADFYEEVKTAADNSSLLQKPLALNPPSIHLKPSQLYLQFMAVKPDLITDRVSVKEATIRSVLVDLFKCRNENFSKAQQQKAFVDDMVEHIHLLLQKEAEKYSKNRVFLQNLKYLEDPKQEVKLSQELWHPLKVRLGEALPNTRLTREGLMEDVEAALVACSLIATKILNHLKPTVSFAAGTKPGDETPYSINIPIKRDERQTKRELTQLELRLQEEKAQAREEVFSAEIVTVPVVATEPKEKTKKKNKLFSLLCKLAWWRKT